MSRAEINWNTNSLITELKGQVRGWGGWGGGRRAEDWPVIMKLAGRHADIGTVNFMIDEAG
ncbi:hypothetical protein A8711_28175 [Micromonospora sp. II]|nr:hypothetical protein A8711_28175 [Micromonospora sp. II]